MLKNINVVKLFEINKTSNGEYSMSVYGATPRGDYKAPITEKEYIRLMNKYDHFITEAKNGKIVFAQDLCDKCNLLYFLRKEYTKEFSAYYA